MTQETPHLSRIQRILEKLEQVRARGLSCDDFDSDEFNLNPRLTEAELLAFEAKHQIRLPEDYRTFLVYAGNGGVGPYSGLFPLAKWDDFISWVEYERPENTLTLPCPLYQEMPRTRDWRKFFGNVCPFRGTLSLGSRGCAFATQLIVTGSYSGRVVYVDADHNEPPYIVHEPDFLSWYERWLDELLQGQLRGWFGYGPGGGEDDFLRILDDPKASDEFKAEGARAFVRLPRLSDNAIGRLPALLDSPLSGVRIGALLTIEKFGPKTVMEKAAPLLDDPVADVRQRAVYTVMKIQPQRWAEAVRHRFLEDSDEKVARAAFSTLTGAKALSKQELLRIIEDPARRDFCVLAADAVEWKKEDTPVLIRLLADKSDHVRSSAIRNLQRVMGRDALPYILERLSHEPAQHIVGFMLKMLGEFAEPATVPVLLEWAQCPDDFNRLEAIDALAKIGDERAAPIAQAMLQEKCQAERRYKDSFGSMSSSSTISQLVRKSLEQSSSPVLRSLTS